MVKLLELINIKPFSNEDEEIMQKLELTRRMPVLEAKVL